MKKVQSRSPFLILFIQRRATKLLPSPLIRFVTRLLHAINSKGIEGAISFCNEKAYPITATYADSVVIRRTALRYRNPKNEPDSLERMVLDEMNQQVLSASETRHKDCEDKPRQMKYISSSPSCFSPCV